MTKAERLGLIKQRAQALADPLHMPPETPEQKKRKRRKWLKGHAALVRQGGPTLHPWQRG